MSIHDFISAEALDNIVDVGNAGDDALEALVKLRNESKAAFEMDQMNKFSQWLLRVKHRMDGATGATKFLGAAWDDILERLVSNNWIKPLAKLGQDITKTLGYTFSRITDRVKVLRQSTSSYIEILRRLPSNTFELMAKDLGEYLTRIGRGQKTLREFFWTFRLDNPFRWLELLKDLFKVQDSAFKQWLMGTKLMKTLEQNFKPLTKAYRKLLHLFNVQFVPFGSLKNFREAIKSFDNLNAAIEKSRRSAVLAGKYFKLFYILDPATEIVNKLETLTNRIGIYPKLIFNKIIKGPLTAIHNGLERVLGIFFGRYTKLLDTELHKIPSIVYNNYKSVFNVLEKILFRDAAPDSKSIDNIIKLLKSNRYFQRLLKPLTAPYKVAWNFVKSFYSYLSEPVEMVQKMQQVGKMYAKPITIITTRFGKWYKTIKGLVKYFSPLKAILHDITVTMGPWKDWPNVASIMTKRLKVLGLVGLNAVSMFMKWKYVLQDFIQVYKNLMPFVDELNKSTQDIPKAVGYAISGLLRLKTFAIKMGVETADQFLGMIQQGIMMFTDSDTDVKVSKFFGNIRNKLKAFMETYEAILSKIPEITSKAFNIVTNIINGNLTVYETGWEKLIAVITHTVSAIVGALVGVFKSVTDPFVNLWDAFLARVAGDTEEMYKQLIELSKIPESDRTVEQWKQIIRLVLQYNDLGNEEIFALVNQMSTYNDLLKDKINEYTNLSIQLENKIDKLEGLIEINEQFYEELKNQFNFYRDNLYSIPVNMIGLNISYNYPSILDFNVFYSHEFLKIFGLGFNINFAFSTAEQYLIVGAGINFTIFLK